MSKSKEFIKNYKLEKKQGVPKGADLATHERCIQDVKGQGHDKASAYAICNAAGAGQKSEKRMKKSIDEFIKSSAGEGSRGGKIIGHTKSGKPIYENKKKPLKSNKKHKANKEQVMSKLKNKIKKLKEKTKEQKESDKEAKKVGSKKGEKSMKKANNKTQIIDQYMELVKSGKMTLEEVEKALTAGYQTSPEKTQQEIKAEVDKQEAEKQATEAKKELKFDEKLFKPFTLGSTLAQAPTGNVIRNVKPSQADYVKDAGPKKMITTNGPDKE